MKTLPVYYKNRIVGTTQVDDSDYESLKDRRWCLAALRGGYARQSTSEARRRGESRYLHRVILRPRQSWLVVDHIDHNPLNNQRSNLRVLTRADNVRHRRGPQKNNSHGHLGVHPHAQSGGWCARITVNKKTYARYSKTLEGAIEARRLLEQQFRLRA